MVHGGGIQNHWLNMGFQSKIHSKCLHYRDELPSSPLAHLSQNFSIIIAPSVLYLTSLVAGFPHSIQNLDFSVLDLNGSILFSVFSNISSQNLVHHKLIKTSTCPFCLKTY